MSEIQKQDLYHVYGKDAENSIRLMARDPNWLYVYWNISEQRKESFIKEFGLEFWEKTTPALKVTNITKSSFFFVRINDFSDNWYINVPDPDCLYMAEIGRRFSDEFFIALSNSNCAATPSNRVSSNATAYFANYTDLRNGNFTFGAIADISVQHITSEPVPGSRELFNAMPPEISFGESSGRLYFDDIPVHPGLVQG